MRDLTAAERAIVQALGDCATGFAALEPAHPNDLTDFVNAIHRCQNIVLARPGTETFMAERRAHAVD